MFKPFSEPVVAPTADPALFTTEPVVCPTAFTTFPVVWDVVLATLPTEFPIPPSNPPPPEGDDEEDVVARVEDVAYVSDCISSPTDIVERACVMDMIVAVIGINEPLEF